MANKTSEDQRQRIVAKYAMVSAVSAILSPSIVQGRVMMSSFNAASSKSGLHVESLFESPQSFGAVQCVSNSIESREAVLTYTVQWSQLVLGPVSAGSLWPAVLTHTNTCTHTYTHTCTHTCTHTKVFTPRFLLMTRELTVYTMSCTHN